MIQDVRKRSFTIKQMRKASKQEASLTKKVNWKERKERQAVA